MYSFNLEDSSTVSVAWIPPASSVFVCVLFFLSWVLRSRQCNLVRIASFYFFDSHALSLRILKADWFYLPEFVIGRHNILRRPEALRPSGSDMDISVRNSSRSTKRKGVALLYL